MLAAAVVFVVVAVAVDVVVNLSFAFSAGYFTEYLCNWRIKVAV